MLRSFFVFPEVIALPLRLCSRCQRPTPNRPAICDECRAKEPEQKREANRQYDVWLRNPVAAAFYHSAIWIKTRAAYLLSVGYLCEDCVAEYQRGERREEDIQIATDVHHMIPLTVDWELRLAWSNLRALCDAHHKAKRKQKP